MSQHAYTVVGAAGDGGTSEAAGRVAQIRAGALHAEHTDHMGASPDHPGTRSRVTANAVPAVRNPMDAELRPATTSDAGGKGL